MKRLSHLFLCTLLASSCKLGLKPPSLSSLARAAEKKGQCDKVARQDVTLKEEQALGGAAALNFVQQGGGLVVDVPPKTDNRTLAKGQVALPGTGKNAMLRYLNEVGKNLGALSSRPSLDWTFGVLDQPQINALSAPGGAVLVSRGLLLEVKNEAQLAGVLAHEIAHIAQRHSLQMYKKVKVDQCNLMVAGSVAGSMVDVQSSFVGGSLDFDSPAAAPILEAMTDSFVNGFLAHGNAQADEYEADRVALELMVAAGYNPHEYIRFIGGLKEQGGIFPHHPGAKDRALALGKHLESMRPDGSSFGNQEWPFRNYPAVPLGKELAVLR